MNNAFNMKKMKKKDEQCFLSVVHTNTKTGMHVHESPREFERQSEAQHMLESQSKANGCQHKCNLKKSHLLMAQDNHQKLGVAFSYLNRN